ncbi:unnamed protein product [Alopecurus aequalis]
MPPMSPPPPSSLLHVLLLLFLAYGTAGVGSSSCGGGEIESCGDLLLPFPFHLNSSSCTAGADANSSSLFRLSCVNATLTLPLGGATFRVLDFLPDGSSLLLDYAPDAAAAPCDPSYAAFSRPSSPAAALDAAAPFLAVSPNNVLRLYACDDSSLCLAGCDDAAASCGGGNKSSTAAAAGCCYPLSDGSVWKPGDGLAVFAGFGCRGFSSWVKNLSAAGVTRGMQVEWAVPRGSALAACAGGAATVNATAVRGGVRCACPPGLVGDGFAGGTGCSKRRACGRECCQGRFCSRKAVALAGFFVSVFFLAAAASFWLFLRQPSPSSGDTTRRWDLDPACIPKILGGICNARQFTYDELDAAKRRFDDGNEKHAAANAVHGGVLDDGTVVAVQRVGYETQDKLRQALDAVALLPEVSHRNVARVVGFCLLDPVARAVLLVHESSAGGTLEDHLRRTAPSGRAALRWHHRVNIAIELASALAYLQAHDAFLHDLRSSDVFLDGDLTAKIAGHKLVSSTAAATSYYYYYYQDASPAAREQDVVCNFGLLLIELLTGMRHQQPFDSVAPKVREGRLHEVLDPTLLLASSSSSGRNQQLPATAEEVRRVLELAVRCLLSAENGMGMAAAARELVHVGRDGEMGSSSSKIEISLEDTFSSSSLLQMISMSPDTLHRHLP